MKTLVRSVLINMAAIWIATQLVEGMQLHGGLTSLLLAALLFGLMNLLLKPVISLLLLPINLLTLGIFSWVINVIMLYLLTKIFPALTLSSWFYPGYTYQGFVIPAFEVSILLTAIIASFIISVITSFFQWLIK
ncbi:MAG TPA: phage holin family protein [Patescibacteria group bacterium]|nr:phage holin family protein [Patescibacteria group bacterium]